MLKSFPRAQRKSLTLTAAQAGPIAANFVELCDLRALRGPSREALFEFDDTREFCGSAGASPYRIALDGACVDRREER